MAFSGVQDSISKICYTHEAASSHSKARKYWKLSINVSLAKAIFCLLPASTSIESKFSSTANILTEKRSRMQPKLFEDIALVEFNK